MNTLTTAQIASIAPSMTAPKKKLVIKRDAEGNPVPKKKRFTIVRSIRVRVGIYGYVDGFHDTIQQHYKRYIPQLMIVKIAEKVLAHLFPGTEIEKIDATALAAPSIRDGGFQLKSSKDGLEYSEIKDGFETEKLKRATEAVLGEKDNLDDLKRGLGKIIWQNGNKDPDGKPYWEQQGFRKLVAKGTHLTGDLWKDYKPLADTEIHGGYVKSHGVFAPSIKITKDEIIITKSSSSDDTASVIKAAAGVLGY